MNRSISLIIALTIYVLLASSPQAKSGDDLDGEEETAVMIALTGLDVNDQTLKLRYQIRNGSQHDIWVCDNINVDGTWDFEVYLAEDSQTLLIRRRLDVPAKDVYWLANPYGRYVRLGAGKDRIESLSLTLPVYPRRKYSGGRRTKGTEYATRLVLDIGFYAEDLSGMIRGILVEAERFSDTRLDHDIEITNKRYFSYFRGLLVRDCFGGLLGFNELNEEMNTSEQVKIPYTDQALKGESVLRITVDGLRIPYSEKLKSPKLSPPDMSRCTRVEIQYQPSMLEYFFPYANEQSLLSPAETQYLQSLKNIVVKNQEHLKALAHDVSEGSDGGIITEGRTAYVICFHDGECLMSFTVYDDTSIITEQKQQIKYRAGFPSMRMLTPQIRPFELRLKCARNLWVLHSRLHTCFISERAYPAPTEWYDAIIRDYRAKGFNEGYVMRPFMCPGVGEGRCHYAMNPRCRPNSRPDMVLLFETKAGWNQHGGPELFTFDNHDPKGGCVLLNDGTVKFIRTKEELQQLRWK